jgi:dihydrofolate synthase/folylpolyglutamate synthase
MADLQQALSQLYRRNLHTVKLGLEVERALCEHLGRPQDQFLALHVAGTNGKGSVCAMLAAVLQAAGFRTGLYTSPHLVNFRERVRVNGAAIPDADLARLLARIELAAKAGVAAGHRDATFFEFTTALAFEYFREQRVQVAVLETGMGGRLDATNVVTPVVSVITSIGLDHQAYLGDTVEKIAAEKAGIIKEGRPVVCGALDAGPLAVIRRAAREAHAPLTIASEACTVKRTAQTLEGQRVVIETEDESVSRVRLPLLGEHQLGNCAVAMAALVRFRDETGLPVAEDAIRRGLGEVRWPARCQVVEREPPLIIDGAHNADAARVLADTLDDLRKRRPLGLVVSFLADKDAAAYLRAVAGSVKRCWIVPLQNERAMPVEQIAAAARAAGLDPTACPDLAQALAAARAWAAGLGGFVCVCGSLYLAGEALRLLDQPA